MESLFKGMDGVVSSKTVVGDAIHIGGTIILPLVDVSFGIGAGAFSGDKKEKGMGGIGGKMSPSAVIVIQDGRTKLVNIKNQDTITKILDMIPDVMDRFSNYKKVAKERGAQLLLLVEEYNTSIIPDYGQIIFLTDTFQTLSPIAYEKSRIIFFIFIEEVIARYVKERA